MSNQSQVMREIQRLAGIGEESGRLTRVTIGTTQGGCTDENCSGRRWQRRA